MGDETPSWRAPSVRTIFRIGRSTFCQNLSFLDGDEVAGQGLGISEKGWDNYLVSFGCIGDIVVWVK